MRKNWTKIYSCRPVQKLAVDISLSVRNTYQQYKEEKCRASMKPWESSTLIGWKSKEEWRGNEGLGLGRRRNQRRREEPVNSGIGAASALNKESFSTTCLPTYHIKFPAI